ncbi:MAG: hypothetical protein OEZ27_05535 [Nitrospinota bacterium]|nr:hypothetical protein [Nitrospinota bacterium]
MPRLILPDEPFTQKLPNITFTITRYGKLLKDFAPIVCPSCKAEISKKEINNIIRKHGVSSRALLVDAQGKWNKRLNELYEKIRKGKIGSAEAFETEQRILTEFQRVPKDDQPLPHIRGTIPIKCADCGHLLGHIDITVTAEPPNAFPPDVKDWIALKKNPKEMRWIRENLLPENVRYENWIDGKDMELFIKKLEAWKSEIDKLPFIRTLQRPIANLHAAVYATIEQIKEDIRTRIDRVYNLLKNPPIPPPQRMED